MLNSSVFKVHLTDNQSVSIEEHCRLLKIQNSWRTQVEIIAVATYFQAPVYIYVCVLSSGNWKWTITKPIQRKSLTYPTTEKSFVMPNHFEMSFAMNHYNCIVSKDNKLPNLPPVIRKSESWVEIDT